MLQFTNDELLDIVKRTISQFDGYKLIDEEYMKAWSKALQSCNDWINENPNYDIDIVFSVLDQKIYDLGFETMKALGINCYTVDLEEL